MGSARAQIELARQLESDQILDKFVEEMRKWASNSPNKTECWAVLEALRSLQD